MDLIVANRALVLDIEYEPTKNLSFYAGISKHSGHSLHDRKALEIGGKFSNSNVLN